MPEVGELGLVRRGRIWEQEDDRLWLWCGRHERR